VSIHRPCTPERITPSMSSWTLAPSANEGDDELFGARRRDAGLRELPIPDRLTPKLPEFRHYLTRPTVLLLKDWIEAIRAGTDASFSPSFADGAKVQEIIDGVIRSGVQGRWIDTSGSRWRTGRLS
jgi:predicted dehydrogenase